MNVLGPDISDSVDSMFAGLVDSVQSGWFLQDSNEFFRGFSISAEDVLLDVGCGDGAATLFSAQRGAHVMFSDINPEAVKELERKVREASFSGGFQSFVCDSDPLLVDDECASRVVCMEVLEHVDSPERVMSELVRAGKPGALYLITVPGEKGEQIQQHFAPSAYFEKPHHIRIFSQESFEQLVQDAGLVIEDYARTGFFWVMWMSMHWAVEAAKQRLPGDTEIRDKIEPPFDESLDRWSSLWVKLTSTPEGLAFKQQMDNLLPKNQIIIARKK